MALWIVAEWFHKTSYIVIKVGWETNLNHDGVKSLHNLMKYHGRRRILYVDGEMQSQNML